jgi:hypothetical protein
MMLHSDLKQNMRTVDFYVVAAQIMLFYIFRGCPNQEIGGLFLFKCLIIGRMLLPVIWRMQSDSKHHLSTAVHLFQWLPKSRIKVTFPIQRSSNRTIDASAAAAAAVHDTIRLNDCARQNRFSGLMASQTKK